MTTIVIWCAIALQFVGKPNIRAYPYQQAASVQGTRARAPENDQTSAGHTDHAEKSVPPWYATPEWWLVGVGILTLLAIYQQSRKTAAAAEATRKSVELQEVALRQWVTIEKWRSTIFWPEEGGLSLHVQFDVVNPTNMLLTLDCAYIIFKAHKLPDQGGRVGRSNLIPPKKSHPVTTTITITEEQMRKWEQDELTFIVNGYIKFRDALEKERMQPFNGMIGCSKNGVRFIPNYGPGLYIADQDEAGNKNPN